MWMFYCVWIVCYGFCKLEKARTIYLNDIKYSLHDAWLRMEVGEGGCLRSFMLVLIGWLIVVLWRNCIISTVLCNFFLFFLCNSLLLLQGSTTPLKEEKTAALHCFSANYIKMSHILWLGIFQHSTFLKSLNPSKRYDCIFVAIRKLILTLPFQDKRGNHVTIEFGLWLRFWYTTTFFFNCIFATNKQAVLSQGLLWLLWIGL